MGGFPETYYARTTDGGYLAYQVLGGGRVDVMVPALAGLPIDHMWDEPAISAGLHRLATFSRLIAYDNRGFGSSDPIDPDAVPALQVWMDDLVAVMDAADSERAVFFAAREAALAVMLFAATFPRRVAGLVLVDAYARFLRSEECPWGLPSDRLSEYVGLIESIWGRGVVGYADQPNTIRNEETRRQRSRAERLSASPRVVAAACRAFMETDLTQVLTAIQATTLVIARLRDPHVRPEHGRYLASHIREARFIELAGEGSAAIYLGAPDILDEVEEFVTGVRPSLVLDRVLATILFTDIVGSTEEASRTGDRRWRDLLNRYDDLVQQNLERFRGRHVKGTGDGTLATFDGPARAIECTLSIARGVGLLGLNIRAGLHTGEIETRGDDVAGMAVHIASRIADLGDPGDVLVSSTVKDLVAGSGIQFTERGTHNLKGVPESWTIFAVSR